MRHERDWRSRPLRSTIVQQEMRDDDVEVTRHQILELGHDSLARRRHSVLLTLGVWELGPTWGRRGATVQEGGRSVDVSLPPDLATVVRMSVKKGFAIAIKWRAVYDSDFLLIF